MEFQITTEDIESVLPDLGEAELQYLETRLDQITESILESWYATSFNDMLREEIKWRIEVRMADEAEVNENGNDDP